MSVVTAGYVIHRFAVTPEQAMSEADRGELRPLYLVMGSETFLVDKVLTKLRASVDMGAAAAFNIDKFVAGEADVDRVLSAARTVPMMAPYRLVSLSSLERWDNKGSSRGGEHPLDALAAYAEDPSPTTILLLSGSKLNGSRRLVRAAKKAGFLVSCESPKRHELPRWIRQTVESMGHRIDGGAVDLIAELMGPELAPVADALERLSLYVGSGNAIDADAIAAVVTRVRQETVWQLVDALAARDLGGALGAMNDAYDPRDRGLPMLGAITWRIRQLLKFQSALLRGGGPKDAAKAAGLAPFKANETERTIKRLSRPMLERWLMLLSEADLALKGSKRPGQEVIATMLIDMCR
jgi:DNA polymerase III subunit delta